MSTYKYKAYDASGHLIEDEIEANNLEQAKSSLQQKSYLIVSIKPLNNSAGFVLPFSKKGVDLDDLEFLTSELAILLNSGVKIDKGLEIVAKGKGNNSTGKVITEINKNLKSGMPVAKAFDSKEKVFDGLYLNLIEIGEKTGKLPQVFSGLANDLKFKKNLKAKILQAVTYPSIIFFVCIACILFVFNYIVPQMGSIFGEGDDLPIYTAFLLAASDWMVNYQLYVALVLGVVVAFIYRNRESASLKRFWSRYALGMPLVSQLIMQIERIRFNSAMALMLDAGVKVDVAIGSAAKNISNQVIRKSMQVAEDKIKKGMPVSTSLAMTPVYPAFYVSLLEVGEESGELSKIFSEIAERSRTDFESWTDRVTNILEPLLILVMGGVVGGVVITMLLSIVSVNDISL